MRVEVDAGVTAEFSNRDYETAGATIVDKKAAFEADVLLKVRPLFKEEITNVRLLSK